MSTTSVTEGGRATRPPDGMVMCPVTITTITPIADTVLRLVIEAADLAGLGPSRHADAFKLFLPPPGEREVFLPSFKPGHLPIWEDGRPQPVIRSYTVRDLDRERGRLTFDVMTFDEGSGWPQRVRAGDEIGFIGMKHGLALASETERLLIVGDRGALPAAGAILDTLPSHVAVTALLTTEDASERALVAAPANGEVHWCVSDPFGDCAPLRKLLDDPAADSSVQVWAAGEVSRVGRFRRMLLHVHAMPAERVHALAYWKAGRTRDDFDAELRSRYRTAAAAGLDISDPVVAADIEFA